MTEEPGAAPHPVEPRPFEVIQWKETTMKAKWVWSSWAHLALAGVIALEALFLTFIVMFIIPRFQMLLREGLIDPDIVHESSVSWLPAFLERLSAVGGGYSTWLLLGSAVAWALFEWRVRGENKPLIRLSLLGTAAVGLTVVGVLTGAALVISFTLGFPAAGRLARSYALEQVSTADASISALEQARAKADWEAMQDQAEQARRAIHSLKTEPPAIPALVRWHAPPTVASSERAINELRAGLETADADLAEAQHAIREKDAARLESAMQKFRKSYETVHEAAKKPKG
jgi:hypothetical protein